jgi:hypothetical protein
MHAGVFYCFFSHDTHWVSRKYPSGIIGKIILNAVLVMLCRARGEKCVSFYKNWVHAQLYFMGHLFPYIYKLKFIAYRMMLICFNPSSLHFSLKKVPNQSDKKIIVNGIYGMTYTCMKIKGPYKYLFEHYVFG